MLNADRIHQQVQEATVADDVYQEPQPTIPTFRFDDRVARVFPDMIKRSVPGYPMTLDMLGVIADRFVEADTRCYDLGCSLGASTLAMRQAIGVSGCRVIGVDSSEAMVERCRTHVEADPSPTPTEILCADIRDIEITNASLVAINFTLQFLPPNDRLALLEKIRAGMRPQGALIIADKIVFDDPAEQMLQTDLHHAFKRANGYSDLEISQKRTAIENYLIPDSEKTHHSRLRQAGFSRVHTWFQCFSFAAIIAQP